MDAQTQTKDGPELYTGLQLTIDEIVIAFNVLQAGALDMRRSFDAKQDIPLKLACDDVAKAAGQINTMASHLSKILKGHINRRTRP